MFSGVCLNDEELFVSGGYSTHSTILFQVALRFSERAIE